MQLADNLIVVCFVVRHGRTVLNATKKFRGSANPPLDEQGIKEAHNLAHLFSNIDISCIFCSDKQRAVKTAETIAAVKHLPVSISKSLRALDVGNFSAKPRNAESEAELQKYLDSPETQIPGGESLNDFKARIQPCLAEAVHIFEECGCPPMIVAHSSVVHECGAMLYGDHKSILVDPGGVIALYFKDGKLEAKPIFKPVASRQSQSGTIT